MVQIKSGMPSGVKTLLQPTSEGKLSESSCHRMALIRHIFEIKKQT
jgi:hypothetical protein